jgi:ABC-type branched-subunit amino acid transport system substrate-binding protein
MAQETGKRTQPQIRTLQHRRLEMTMPRQTRTRHGAARTAGIFATVIAIAAAATACSSSSGSTSDSSSSGSTSSQGPYDVAIVASITGVLGPTSAPGVAGFKAFVNYADAHGGVNGRQIRVTVYDDQSTATASYTAAQQAIGTSPLAILDAGITQTISARMPSYASAKIPVYAIFANSTFFYPWLTSSLPTAGQYATAYTTSIKSILGGSLKGKRVAWVSLASSGEQANAALVKSQLAAAGGQLISQTYQPAGSPSFAGASSVVLEKPDAVMLADVEPSELVEAKALRNAGYTGPIQGGFGISNPSMAGINSNSFYNITALPNPAPGDALYTQATADGDVQYVTSSYYSQGWVLAGTMAAALKKCGASCSSQALAIATHSLGSYTVAGLPDSPLTKFSLTQNLHNPISMGQALKWSITEKNAIPSGNPFTLGAAVYGSS